MENGGGVVGEAERRCRRDAERRELHTAGHGGLEFSGWGRKIVEEDGVDASTGGWKETASCVCGWEIEELGLGFLYILHL